MEVISHCGPGGLVDYKPSRRNLAWMKLEGQLGMVEYSRITIPDSVHMGDPAGGFVEMHAQGEEFSERALDGLE